MVKKNRQAVRPCITNE